MSFLSHASDTLSNAVAALFSSSEKIQLRAAFKEAAQAIRSNDTQALKTLLGNTKFNREDNQSLLVDAISVDNVEGFKTILNATGIAVSERLKLTKSPPLAAQILDTPMLPYAISRGSEKISSFLASHDDTDLKARALITYFNSCVCPSTGSVYAHSYSASLRNAQSIAKKAGMTDVAEIITGRIRGQRHL